MAQKPAEFDPSMATKKEKLLFLQKASAGAAPSVVSMVVQLLGDSDAYVRELSLQKLVLDIKQKDGASELRCWEMLREDESEDVRFTAAACLGSILSGSFSLSAFLALKEVLKDSKETTFAKEAVYNSMLQVADMPPSAWSGLAGSREPFQEAAIDWDLLASLETKLIEFGR